MTVEYHVVNQKESPTGQADATLIQRQFVDLYPCCVVSLYALCDWLAEDAEFALCMMRIWREASGSHVCHPDTKSVSFF